MKNWNDRLKLVESSPELEVKFTFAAILFRATFIRALNILGTGKTAEKNRMIKESQGHFTKLWKKMLSKRLGVHFKSLREVIEGDDKSLNFDLIRFAAFVTLHQIASGFDHFYSTDSKSTLRCIDYLVEASRRVKCYVESFGIGFDDRISPAKINRLLKCQI